MGDKTYAQLTPASDVQDADLSASFRGGSGPLKRITMAILKAYFTDNSLLLDGSQAMTGQLEAEVGTAAAPGVTFVGSLGTGVNAPTTDTLGLSAGGVEVLRSTLSGGGLYRPVVAKATGYTVVKNDVGVLFECTSTFTLALTAAAVLTAGHNFGIRNTGTGVITVDPNGSETIDGRTTICVYPGEGFEINCDGTGFVSQGRKSSVLLNSTTVSVAAASVEITDGFTDTEFRYFQAIFGMKGATGGAIGHLLMKTAGSYGSAHSYALVQNVTTTLTGLSEFNRTYIRLTYSDSFSEGALQINLSTAASPANVNISDYDSGNIASLVGNGAAGGLGSSLSAIKFIYDSGNVDVGSGFQLTGFR